MSLDRSFRSANSLVRHRNVLTRAERLEVLKEEERWEESKSVFGLPKVAHRKAAVGGKAAKEEAPAVGGVEGAAAVAAPGAAAPGVAVPAAGAGAGATAAKVAGAGAAPAGKGKKRA